MEINATIRKLNEIDKLINDKELEKAEEKLNELLENTEKTEISTHGQIFDFENDIQFVFYCNKVGKSRNIEWKQNFLSEMYLQKAMIYYEKQEYDEALKQLKISLKWNPVKTHAYMEILEIYIKTKSWDQFEKTVKEAIEISTTPLEISIFYKKYAYFFIEKGEYEIAYNILRYTTLIYYREENIDEIRYLSKIVRIDLKKTADIGTIQYIQEHGLEYKTNLAVISAHITMAKAFENRLREEKEIMPLQERKNILNRLITIYTNLYFFDCEAEIHNLQMNAIRELQKIIKEEQNDEKQSN